ncbi:DUF3987 domain-containing protein [Sulfuricystis thermophila]|uniref:DUF3987 domain-containing protein n=1 Tax=Sulfuricystis thermophila TaxID=2496847 RepID=UPI001035874C|nr:DUF3987 domain-containing protein [Sulfuricystis thermophila]
MSDLGIPEALRARRQWLIWKLEEKPGAKKPAKMPYYANGKRRTGQQGSAADRAALVDYVTALAAVEQHQASGLGFAFLPDDGLIGIDLDNKVDAETGEISPSAQRIIEACASYTEWSPSGRGFHIYVAGSTQTAKDNGKGIEMFCGRQFFTVTGKHLTGTPVDIRPIEPDVLARLHQAIKGSNPTPTGEMPVDAKIASALDYLSPDCGYDDWLHVGMAIHAELGESGFALWNRWSAKSGKYPGEREMRAKWKSFRPGAITGATLYGLAHAAGWRVARLVDTNTPPTPKKSPSGDSGASVNEDAVWPDPIQPGSRTTPEIPAAILPGIFGEHAAAVAQSTQTPPALATLFTISVLGCVLHGRFEVSPFDDDYRESLAIWTNTCYPVGGRKTAVFAACCAPLVRFEKLAGDRARPEIYRRFAAREVATKRIEKLRQDAAREDNAERRAKIEDEIRRTREEMPDELKAPRIFTTNATPERCESLLAEQGGKIGILSDESDTFLNLSGALRGGVASLDVVLKGHAGSAIRVDRQGREAHLDRPCLSMGLIVQPESFAELAAGRRLRATGVLARYLYAIPKSNIGLRDVRQRCPIPQRVADDYQDAVLRLLDGYEERGREPRILPFTAAALEPWLSFAEGVERHQGEGGRYEAISDWTSKLPGHAARLAALFQIAEEGLDAVEIGIEAVNRALDLCRLLVPHAEAAFAMLGSDDTDIDALAVLRWIKAGNRQYFTRREAQRAMHGRFSKVERLERALAHLRDLYVISGEKKAATGGRASAYYLVNPKLHVTKGAA